MEESMKNNKKWILVGVSFIIILGLGVLLGKLLFGSSRPDEMKMEFVNDSYSCNVGENVDVMFKITDTKEAISFIVSDNTIGNIYYLPNISLGERKITISCKKVGETILKATYDNNELATTKIIVNKVNKPISFEKNSYTCQEGKVISTFVNGENIEDFTSTSESIAEVTKSSEQDLDCECTKINIKCKKTGNVFVSAKKNGETISSSVSVLASEVKPTPTAKVTPIPTSIPTPKVTVKPSLKPTPTTKVTPQPNINFENNSYTCEVGDVFKTKIIGASDVDIISSSDNSIATISKTNALLNCQCTEVKVECKKEGTTTLTAIYGNAKKTITLTVSK